MIDDGYNIQNSGNNSGVMVGNNYGIISINSQNMLKIPSLISSLVKLLGNECYEKEYTNNTSSIQDFKPDEKIEYNAVIKYREIIKEYSIYYVTCNNYLNTYDDSHIGGKAKILKCIHTWYLGAKGDVLLEKKESGKKEMDIVRENSDRIIDMVKEHIIRIVHESREIETTYQEEIELGITCFICYCFMECKILEKPL